MAAESDRQSDQQSDQHRVIGIQIASVHFAVVVVLEASASFIYIINCLEINNNFAVSLFFSVSLNPGIRSNSVLIQRQTRAAAPADLAERLPLFGRRAQQANVSKKTRLCQIRGSEAERCVEKTPSLHTEEHPH